jgi:hypothetical protein
MWFTYRTDIGATFKSDVGWGCMIRVCQMMLAEAHKRVMLSAGRPKERRSMLSILTAFIEDSMVAGKYNPFSIQNFMTYARTFLKKSH